MGYRSDVKSLIYGTADAMTAFKQAHFELYNQVREDFGDTIKDMVKHDLTILYLNCEYTKWYDEYEEVQRWSELYDLADQDGLSTEFIRIGESSEGDIEVLNGGDDCVYYLETEQKIVTILDDEV